MQNRFTCLYECNALYVYRCNVLLDPEAETRSFRIGRRCLNNNDNNHNNNHNNNTTTNNNNDNDTTTTTTTTTTTNYNAM